MWITQRPAKGQAGGEWTRAAQAERRQRGCEEPDHVGPWEPRGWTWALFSVPGRLG